MITGDDKPVVPFPVRMKTSSSPFKGNVAVLQCRGRMDAAWVDDLLDAQSSGASAALIVNFTGNQLAVPGELRTSIPVLILPLTVGTKLVYQGAADCSFSVGKPSGGGDEDSAAASTAEEGIPPEPEPEPADAAAMAAMASPRAPAKPDDSSKTVWVGGLPESLLTIDMTASSDTGEAPIAAIFKQFGAIVSLTTRQKPELNKSWAFVTFADSASAEAALGATVQHGAVTLQVARADVAEQLKRGNTGALARIWQAQQEKEEAWMRSLLEGLEADDQYINAKREIAKAMGLRAEELEDELEVQELEDLHGRLNEVVLLLAFFVVWRWLLSLFM